jgi:hypothetical protein
MVLNAPVGHDVTFVAACAPSAAVPKNRSCLLTEIKTPKRGKWGAAQQRVIFELFSGTFLLETVIFAHYTGVDATNFRAMFSSRYQPNGRLSLAAAYAKLAECRYLLQKMASDPASGSGRENELC